MGEYANAIGIWEHELAGIKFSLKPTKKDNLELVRLKNLAKKNNDEPLLMEGIQNIYFGMVLASKPEMKLEDQEELKELIGVNLAEIVNDMMIAFKWTTAADLEKLKEKIMNEETKN